MNKKPSALSVLAKMADLDLKEFVFAFPLNTNFKYARTGREGWGEVTIAVTNHIIANIDKFSGSLYMADKDAYADIEKTLEQEGAAFDEMKVRAEAAEARAERLQVALRGLMQFHPEDELGPTTEEFWTPEYKAAIDAARDALKGGEE